MTARPPGYRSTADAVSPDSGVSWAQQGAWPVTDGLWRIPLPLPDDVLRAVNVYVLECESGLTLVDGGWAVREARDVLEASLASIGHDVRDIRRFLVTHAHRDHYTLAAALGAEFGATTLLGADEEPTLQLENVFLDPTRADEAVAPLEAALLGAGVPELLPNALAYEEASPTDPRGWGPPTRWLDGDQTIEVDGRSLSALHTPGHTPGHFVFADLARGLLFAGDHVLPTITPSIGYTFPLPENPLADFLGSLAKVRGLPDLGLLPAHGPVGGSTHGRVDELVAFHEGRLDQCLAGLRDAGSTAADVARTLPWTRRDRSYAELDVWNQELAALETKAHLEVLVARGSVSRQLHDATYVYRRAVPAEQP